ncbi:hypothetical protein R3I94_016681 [Phoxinus phoxinus]
MATLRRRAKGQEEHEMRPLLNDNDESFTDEAGPDTGFDKKRRLVFIGGDDALMDKACSIILGERQSREEFKFGELKPKTAQVCGRQVSVLKTPFTWLEHLKSFLFFSRKVKSIRNEIESYESMMFPGPHAFLLVHRDVNNSGKDYYLLRALSKVFGKEILDYCMVLFMDGAKHDPKKNDCVKMCGSRYHILHNTDKSVNELFTKTETYNKQRFFIKHLECYKAATNYFDENENKLRRELAENKETADNLKREIKDMKELNAMKVTELNDDLKKSQGLNEELIIYKNREREDKERLQKQIEQLKDNEKQLQHNLTEANRKVAFLNKKIQSECNIIQREEEVKAKDRELNKREKELDREVKELDGRQRNLDERLKELEIRERDVRSRDHHLQATADPAVSRDKRRPLDEREEELKSKDDSQASGSPGIQKPVRRNSKELEPPNMTKSEHRPLHSL